MKHKIYTKTVFDMTKLGCPIVYEEWEWSDRPKAYCKSGSNVGGSESERQGQMSKTEERFYKQAEKLIKESMEIDKENRPLIRELINQGYTEEDAVTLAAKQRALDAFEGKIPTSPALEKELEDQRKIIGENLARRGMEPGSTPYIQTMDTLMRREGDLREESRRDTLGQASDIYQTGHLVAWGLSDQDRFNRISALYNMGKGSLQGAGAYGALGVPYMNERNSMLDATMQGYAIRNQANIAKSQRQSELWSGIGEGISSGAGSCCFIFIAGHGFLHPIVRKYRDNHMTKRNRRGYYWLSDRIVPLMKRSKIFKKIVRLVMIDPMTSYGKYYYNLNKVGVVFSPITSFWLRLFTVLGYRKPYQRKGTLEIV